MAASFTSRVIEKYPFLPLPTTYEVGTMTTAQLVLRSTYYFIGIRPSNLQQINVKNMNELIIGNLQTHNHEVEQSQKQQQGPL